MIFRVGMLLLGVKAAWRSLVTFFKGKPVFVTPEAADARLDVCEGCIFFHRESRQCQRCACFVDAKAMLVEETCPEGFWPR